MRAIVIYATCEGQTRKIAKRIAETLSDNGVPTDTFDVAENYVTELSVDAYQAVVLGSSLHFGQHDPRIAWCIGHHRNLLHEIPTAFFSVSLGIISQIAEDRMEAEKLADDFLRAQDFAPSRQACFAGALRYSNYGWLKKHLMQWIAKKSGSVTRTDRDYDYTDWDIVDAFSVDFARFIHSCRQPPPNGPRFANMKTPQRPYSVHSKQSV